MFPSGIPLSKRCLDLAGSSLGLLILSPVLAMIALLVWLFLGRPIFFSQIRPGYRARPFKVFKFRSMKNTRDGHGNLLSDDQRLTGLGRFLRASSLDELPELVNVLRGEMSLVGPRPLLMQYLPRYTPEQARRHAVLPGISGWAQVNGRNTLSWEDKFRLDVWYVDHWSFWLDVKILYLSVVKAIRREGISQPGFATAQEFMGSAPDLTAHQSNSQVDRPEGFGE
jgi:lipopolysaccharide/colanic/teichoic acid biosynthesis glycosyltransferase